MTGVGSRLTAIACALMLAGCVLPGGQGGGGAKAPNPVTGGEIETVSLDEPAGETGAAKPAAGKPAKETPADKAVARPEAARAAGPNDPRPKPRPEATTDAVATPEAVPPVPDAEKSAAQMACEKKKGIWSKAGKGGNACVTYTRDGGKSCTSAKDCDSQCLARSGTCAPIKPLFGCNEILDEMGRRMTLCVD
jgi:hypothetical protein